jgi:hypothetical protein
MLVAPASRGSLRASRPKPLGDTGCRHSSVLNKPLCAGAIRRDAELDPRDAGATYSIDREHQTLNYQQAVAGKSLDIPHWTLGF